MATLKTAVLASINVSYQMSFDEGRRRAQKRYLSIASEYPGSGDRNIYPWLLGIKGMQEWKGEKNFQDLSAVGYELRHKDWEDSISVDRNAIADDQYGLYNPMFEELGFVGEDLPNHQVQSLLENGEATTVHGACWDGKAFFATDHPVHPNDASLSTFANLFTSTSLTRANLITQMAAFMQQKGPDGKPRGIPADTLFVHPNQYVDAVELVSAKFISGASSSSPGSRENVIATMGMLKVEQLPLSSEDGEWFLGATVAGGMVSRNPLVVQIREAPHLVTPPTLSEAEFLKRKLQYSTEARIGFGYGKPWQLWKHKN